MATFDKNDTQQKIVQLVADQLSIDVTTINGTEKLDDLGADSLDMVEIIMKLEENFGIEINDDDAETLSTLAVATVYVHERRTK